MRKIDILHIVYHISIDTCLDTTKAPIIGAFVVSLHLQVARWLLPSVTSTKKGGPPPSFFVCVKTCLTLTSFVIYYDT